MTKAILPLVLLATLLGGSAFVHATSSGAPAGTSRVAPTGDLVLASETDPTGPTDPAPIDPTLPTQPNTGTDGNPEG